MDAARFARMVPGIAVAAVCADGMVLSGSAGMTAAAAGLAATVGGAMLGTGWRRIGRTGRVYAASVTAYAAMWAGVISAHGGPFWHGDGWLLAGASVLAAPWAYRHRWRYEQDEPLPEPTPIEEISEFQEIWREYVAVSDGPLHQTYLTPEWGIPGGKQADVILPRGRLAAEDVIAQFRKIRSAYDVAPTQLAIEETPDRRATRARITVLEREELATARAYEGPTLDVETGLARIGFYLDGQPAHMQFWAPGSGAVDTFVVGTKGSGKSRFLDREAAELHLCPLTVLWIADAQGGASLGDWLEGAARYAVGGEEFGYEEIMRMIRAYHRIVDRRSTYHARDIEWVDRKGRERKGGKTFYDPTPQMPLLHLLGDELHLVVQHPVHGKEAVHRLGLIAKTNRKSGGAITYATHKPSEDEMGGRRAGIFRAMLREGNAVGLRTGESGSHDMMGLKLDPSKLPAYFSDGSKTQGLGYIKGPDMRETAQFRAEYVEDAYGIACLPAAGQLDAMSLEAAAEPDDPALAPRTFVVPGVPIIPSAAEQQTWAEKILPLLADGADKTFKAIWTAFPDGTSDRSIRYGLKTLVKDGLAATDGDKKPYRITDAGRSELERRSVAA